MTSNTGAERLSKEVLSEPAPCDMCFSRPFCMHELACEQFAFYCGFYSTVKGEEERTLNDCSKTPSRAMYLRIYPPSGEYVMGMGNIEI